MEQITIFLASSIGEFKKERNALRAFCADLSDLLDDYGYDIEMFACETYDQSIQSIRTQEKYNEFIKKPCDIFFNLYGTKAGMYTIEEMNVALDTYSIHHKPNIYVGFVSDIENYQDETLLNIYKLANESPIVHLFDYEHDSSYNITQLKLVLLKAIQAVKPSILIEQKENALYIYNQRIMLLTK